MQRARKPTTKELNAVTNKSNGKGDKPRPTNRKKYAENFDSIFGERLFPWEKKKKRTKRK